MTKLETTILGLDELKRAIARNPEFVVQRTREFLVRGIAAYKRVIIRNPWIAGSGSGGGAPVNTGNLRDTHVTRFENFEAAVGPSKEATPYAAFVHGIEGYPRKRNYQLRPWLTYAKQTADGEIQQLEKELLTDIRDQLAT